MKKIEGTAEMISIVEHKQENKERANYGNQTLKQLSKDLTKEFGKGFSVSNL